MSASQPAHADPAGRAPTLGDLLYSDPSRLRISETDWLALVKAIAAGDVRAFKALFGRTHRLVFTLAIRIARDRTAAEDLTLDVFDDVWQQASAYDPAEASVLGWLMNLTRARANDRAPNIVLVERTESAARLRAALTTLSAEEHVAIEMAYFSDSTYSEVAQRLDKPLSTIRRRIKSALTKLRFAFAR